MTKDEAIAKANAAMAKREGPVMGNWIEVFAALGMLKLEEPKSARERFITACLTRPTKDLNPSAALDMLDVLGLKIVEK